MWKTVLILLCVLVSVATAQMIARTAAGSFIDSWQVDAVKYDGDKFMHWHFEANERRHRLSEHEWIESSPQWWFNAVAGVRYLKERICDDCLRWEILIWKSSPSPSAESALGNFEELVARIEKKKEKRWGR